MNQMLLRCLYSGAALKPGACVQLASCNCNRFQFIDAVHGRLDFVYELRRQHAVALQLHVRTIFSTRRCAPTQAGIWLASAITTDALTQPVSHACLCRIFCMSFSARSKHRDAI